MIAGLTHSHRKFHAGVQMAAHQKIASGWESDIHDLTWGLKAEIVIGIFVVTIL